MHHYILVITIVNWSINKLVANITAYLQHLTMYSIYIQSSLLLIGYCFVAMRRSAIYLSSAYTSCCLIFSSALLHRALAFVTNGNSPLFSHFSYNSFEVDRREETSVFNRLRLPSNSCVASVSSFLFLVSFLLLFFLLLGQVIGISSSSMSSRHHMNTLLTCGEILRSCVVVGT